MNKDTSGPAFPCTEANGLNNGLPGMTLRQWYAGLAMQGIFAYGPGEYWTNERIATEAFAMADAMIEEGSK